MTLPGRALIAVVSDGAGSAPLSALGSRIVTSAFSRSAQAFVARDGRILDIDENEVSEWLDAMRDQIAEVARRCGERPRAFAATLVGCVIGPDAAAIVHIGDGACALRRNGSQEWEVPSWPVQGEYASTTFFVTDEPAPATVVRHVVGRIDELAVFSDGLERLALDFNTKKAFSSFFETMFAPLRSAPAIGRDRSLSRDLRAFLNQGCSVLGMSGL
jgi:hypothetical protein